MQWKGKRQQLQAATRELAMKNKCLAMGAAKCWNQHPDRLWDLHHSGFQTSRSWATWSSFKSGIVIHRVGLNDLQVTFQSKFFHDSVIPISCVNRSLISEKQQGTFILMGLQDIPPVRSGLRHHYCASSAKNFIYCFRAGKSSAGLLYAVQTGSPTNSLIAFT